MLNGNKYFSYLLLAGLFITYMLALACAIDIKTPDPRLTNTANAWAAVLGWAAALIATGTFVVTMFALNKYEVENKKLREHLGATGRRT